MEFFFIFCYITQVYMMIIRNLGCHISQVKQVTALFWFGLEEESLDYKLGHSGLQVSISQPFLV